jgi:hypothetical protein
LLLQSQFKVATLEGELDQLDAAEKNPLCLASLERERNEERIHTLAKLKDALQEYGKHLDPLRMEIMTERQMRNWSGAENGLSFPRRKDRI